VRGEEDGGRAFERNRQQDGGSVAGFHEAEQAGALADQHAGHDATGIVAIWGVRSSY
jgi:hypothetical protein